MSDWQPVDTAPYLEAVEIRAGNMTFRAILEPGISMDEAGNPCDQWVAANEGEHPPCWTGGVCWQSNENEDMSLQPEAWRLIVDPQP